MVSPVKIWRRQKESRNLLGKKGEVVTWTKIYVSGSAFKKEAPYSVVLVLFEDGEKAVGQLVDYKETDLNIGTKVIAVLRKVREGSDEGVIAYGIKFKPV